MVDPCGHDIQGRKLLIRSDLWWNLASKTFKSRNLMEAAFSGPMWASHPNVEKLMINATYDEPMWAKHPKVKSY